MIPAKLRDEEAAALLRGNLPLPCPADELQGERGQGQRKLGQSRSDRGGTRRQVYTASAAIASGGSVRGGRQGGWGRGEGHLWAAHRCGGEVLNPWRRRPLRVGACLHAAPSAAGCPSASPCPSHAGPDEPSSHPGNEALAEAGHTLGSDPLLSASGPVPSPPPKQGSLTVPAVSIAHMGIFDGPVRLPCLHDPRDP